MVARRAAPAPAAGPGGDIPSALRALVAVIALVAVAVLVLAVLTATPPTVPWGAVALLALCTLVADLIPVVDGRNAYGNLTTAPPFVTGLLAVAGPQIGLPVTAGTVVVATVVRLGAAWARQRETGEADQPEEGVARTSTHGERLQLAWSPATRLVAAGAAALVLGWEPTTDLLAVLTAAAVYAAVMVALTVAAAATDSRRPLREVLLDQGRLLAVVLIAALLVVSPVIALVAHEAPVLLPTLMIPQALVWRSRQQDRARERQLMLDPLTGLPTRPGFVASAEELLGTPAAGTPAVVLLDLDRFRDIEAVLGDDAAEDVLRAVAARIREVAGALPVGNLGGDRFAIAMRAQPFAPAHHLAQQVRNAIARPVNVDGIELRMSAVIGIAQGDSTVETLLRRASVASQQAASSGDGLAIHRSEEPLAVRRRFEVLAALSAAMEDPAGRGLRPQFQPIVDPEGYLSSAEALARWEDPVLGPVPPDEFIPLAEQTGLVAPLFDAIVAQALSGCRRWREAGLQTSVSVNLSPHNLREPLLVSSLQQRLAESGLPPDALTIEVTESAVMQDSAVSRRVLQEIRTIGCGIALDDFGVGYSSLARLRDLPVDVVKLDKSFVDRLLEDPRVRAIILATLDVCRALDLRVVAEGVETDEQADTLIEMGVDRLQGYLFAPAMTVEELIGTRTGDPA